MTKYPHIFLAAILIYFVILGLMYAQTVPIFEASDEAEHVIYIHTILERGELPVIQSSDEMNRQTDPIARWNNQAHHAPLYYLLGAATVAWSERADLADYLVPNELIFLRNTTEDNANKWLHPYGAPQSDTHQAVFVLRLVSIALGCGTLLLVYWAAKQLFEDNFWPLLATLFAASIPTFIVVNSSASNDPLTILLYTAGVGWLLKIWRTNRITRADTGLIGLILAGIVLTKLTGASLFGVVYAVLLVGAWRKKWSWQVVGRVIVLTGVVAALCAGWWYIRNWQIYGDPLALAATQSIWGRGDPLTLAMLPDELVRIGKSFWMMVGYLHQPVFAPDVFYGFAAVVTLLGLVGIVWGQVTQGKNNRPQQPIVLLVYVCFVVIAMLLYGTRSVDISYGRLLLPAIAAFIPLMLIGWRQFLGRWTGVLVVPFVGLAVATPLFIIPAAYPTLEPLEEAPDDVVPIGWQADSLALVAIDLHQTRVQPQDVLTLDLYFRGNHPDNPALLVTAADSLRATRLGHVEVYPGMAATNQLDADQLYRVPVTIALDDVPNEVRQPRLVAVLVEWVNLEDNRALTFDSGRSLYEIMQVTLVDPRYEAEPASTKTDVMFGEFIALEGYDIAESEAGEVVVDFVWRPLQPITTDWTLTVQAFDADGNLLAQTDEMPYWYPTRAWAAGVAFNDQRTLALPDDVSEYDLRIGWYRQTETGTFERLPVRGKESEESVDDLLTLRD